MVDGNDATRVQRHFGVQTVCKRNCNCNTVTVRWPLAIGVVSARPASPGAGRQIAAPARATGASRVAQEGPVWPLRFPVSKDLRGARLSVELRTLRAPSLQCEFPGERRAKLAIPRPCRAIVAVAVASCVRVTSDWPTQLVLRRSTRFKVILFDLFTLRSHDVRVARVCLAKFKFTSNSCESRDLPVEAVA